MSLIQILIKDELVITSLIIDLLDQDFPVVKQQHKRQKQKKL